MPQAAIAQELVLDMKPYIDENNLKDAVGLNYTQNDIDGHIYSVHDQMESRGMWYNQEILDQAGVTLEDLSTWDGYEAAMEKVRALGGDTYGYAAGQGSHHHVQCNACIYGGRKRTFGVRNDTGDNRI